MPQRLGRWYSVTAYSPAKGDFVTVFEDITQRKQAETELRRQREWLHVSLNSIGDAVIATDANQCVAFINPVACRPHRLGGR